MWDTRVYSPWVPLGLLYLGTVLQQKGFTVKILDAAAKRYGPTNVVRWLKQVRPELIGITALTMAFPASIELIKAIKEWDSSIKIALGHYHPTMESKNIIHKYGDLVDYCVRGDGEFTLLKLCEHLDKNGVKNPIDVKGITFKDLNNKIVSTPDYPLNIELDMIPFPDRKLIDFEYRWNFAGFEISSSKFTSAISSRGCPFACSYCACSKFAKRRWRPRSPENIVEELLIIEEQGYTEINFVDDNFTLQPKRVRKLCELIKKEKIDINWHTDGRVDQTSQEMLHWMKIAGCKSIWFGFESANQRILNLYNKKTRVSQFNEAIRKTRKANIELIVGLFMLGAPTETLNEVRTTLNFAMKSNIDIPFFNIVEIWSGIKFWDDFITNGIINPHDKVQVRIGNKIQEVERWETTSNVMELTLSPSLHAKILKDIHDAYRSFFSLNRGKYFFKQAIRMMKSKFMVKMILNFLANSRHAMRALVKFRNLKPRGFGSYYNNEEIIEFQKENIDEF